MTGTDERAVQRPRERATTTRSQRKRALLAYFLRPEAADAAKVEAAKAELTAALARIV